MSFVFADWVWRVSFSFSFFGLFWMPAHFPQRITSPPTGAERCKLSVLAEASSHFSPSLPPESLSPFLDHFHPATNGIRLGTLRPEARHRGSPFLAVNIVPHDEQVCRVQNSPLRWLLNLVTGTGNTGH